LLCEVASAERLVLGSDYPMPIGDPDPVATVLAAGFDDHARQRILRDTALNLFGID
jgi:aminocarboxymuconate-semialdehyde decarboxylase